MVVIERDNPEVKMAAVVTDLKGVLRSIPKFDGKTNVDLFCVRCDAIINAKKIDSLELLLNFHLLLEGEVQDWWKFTQIKFIRDLSADNKDAKWGELKNALKLFYEPESVKKEARKVAGSIRFVDCMSAGEYVSKKLCYFGIMDPNMTEKKQVEKLIKGLPDSLRNIMYASEPENPTEFLHKLRKMEKPDKKKQNGSEATPSSSTHKKFSSSSRNSSESDKETGKGGFGKRACFYCKEQGHLIKDCPKCPYKKEKSSATVYEVSGESTEPVIQSKNE